MKRESYSYQTKRGNTVDYHTVTKIKDKGRITTIKSTNNSRTGVSTSSSSSFNLFGLVFALFLIIVVARAFSTDSFDDLLSFSSFLQFLQTVPFIDMPFNIYTEVSVLLPSWLSWLAPFADFFGSLFNVVWFLITGVLQLLTFVVWFLGWIFL